MRKETLRAAARACTLWLPQRGTGPWPCVYLCGGRMAQMLAPCLAQEPPLALCCVEAAGARDFTPWPAPPLAHGEAFTGGAKEYLACLLEEVAPCLEARYGIDGGRRALAGYSLGGLCALWSAYQTDAFAAVASLSGSLWYDRWTDYMRGHGAPRTEAVYLSLGSGEARAGPPRLRAVGGATQETYEHLIKTMGAARVTLQMHPGGHFNDIPGRWQAGLAWIAARLVTRKG